MTLNQQVKADLINPPLDINVQIQFINGARGLCEQGCVVMLYPDATETLRAIEQSLITIKLINYTSNKL